MMNENPEPETPAPQPAPDIPTEPAKAASTSTPRSKTKKTAKARADKKQIQRPYPRATLNRAITVAMALKEKNGGEAWSPKEVAKAMGRAWGSETFFYEASAAQKFGLVNGGRDAKEISLTPFGRQLVYPDDAATEARLLKEAFLKVPLFKQALEHYKSPDAIDMQYVGNVLKTKFNLEPEIQEEFVDLFRKNCAFVGIKSLADATGSAKRHKPLVSLKPIAKSQEDVETIAEPEDGDGPTCFVIMPFGEKGATPRPPGFFQEVLNQLVVPAAKAAGFRVQTARKKGTEVIQATIVNNVMDADLVVADLTDHNPNVLCELGMRLMADRPVAIIKALGTPPVFDVDNMLRVEDYNPNLWTSSVEQDRPKLAEHIRATWDGRDSQESFLRILRRSAQEKTSLPKAN